MEVRQTNRFRTWLEKLDDRRAVEKIAQRLVRLEAGLFGDAKSVGGKVSELRIDHGPGYRIYFTMIDAVIVILLCGGDKRTQSRDIKAARKIVESLQD